MHARRSSTVVLAYVGAVASALAMIAFGLSTILTAAAGMSQASDSDRTLLQAQIESSREIRKALATPVSIPPLPPITAHLARSVTSVSPRKRPAVALSPQALNSMAMAQTAAPPPAVEPEASPRYQPRDRMAIGGW
jgi:hypothetical protein